MRRSSKNHGKLIEMPEAIVTQLTMELEEEVKKDRDSIIENAHEDSTTFFPIAHGSVEAQRAYSTFSIRRKSTESESMKSNVVE